MWVSSIFFFQAEDGIRDSSVTGVQTCALPICMPSSFYYMAGVYWPEVEMRRLIPLLLAAALFLCAADLNQDLLDAARQGDLPSVKALLEKGAALETKTTYAQTPPYLAAMNGHDAVVKSLL